MDLESYCVIKIVPMDWKTWLEKQDINFGEKRYILQQYKNCNTVITVALPICNFKG